MQTIATITSKRQLTIPVSIFKKLGFSENQKVIVTEGDGVLRIIPSDSLVEQLAGSVEVPKKFKNKPIDKMVSQVKKEYFKEKDK